MTAPTYEKLTAPNHGTRVTVDCERQLEHPRRPHRLPAARRRHRPRRRRRPRHHHLRRQGPRRGRRQGLRRQEAHRLVRRSRRRRRPRAVLPAGQGRAGRHAQRGRAAPALPARRHAQGVRVLQHRPQGPADHAHRRRLPQHQRLPAHPLRPLRLRPARSATSRASRPRTSGPTRSTWSSSARTRRTCIAASSSRAARDKAKKVIALLKEMGYNVAAVGRHRHQADEPRGQQAADPHGHQATPSTRSCPASR